MAIYVDKKRTPPRWVEETCKVKSKMFYTNVGNQIVYVTVTIQGMPAAMEQYPSHDTTIEEYIAGIGKVMEAILDDDEVKRMEIYLDKNANPELRRKVDMQRMSVFIEAKRKLNKRLMKLPDGNLEKLAKLNAAFDEIIDDELNRL